MVYRYTWQDRAETPEYQVAVCNVFNKLFSFCVTLPFMLADYLLYQQLQLSILYKKSSSICPTLV